ncbi:MAG TPA: disulfide bond formation protein B [Methylophilus sp.]|nr:disulfide bond formation protein B [Methylophilus sp.]HQQ32826.1 disulfide bond formation protein B [Methylophilus sp.]
MQQLFSGKRGYLLGFVGCFGLVALALWIQTYYKLEPCPLCITQRIVFMALGVAFLLGALMPDGWPKKLMAMLQVLTAIGGAGVAVRHWWIQAHKESMVADCGVGFDYMFENFPLSKAFKLLFRGTGDCATIDWTFLGLTIPQLSIISFIGFGCYAAWLFKLSKR